MNQSLKYVIFLYVIIIRFTGLSQDIKVYDHFADFEPILQQKNDTTYVINFWATWCKPCLKELPDFLDVNERYKDEKFMMILVSLDFDTHLETKVKPFVKERSIDAKVVLLADTKQNQWINKVNTEWSGSIPITIIFNKDYYFFREGIMNIEELNDIIIHNIKK